MHQTTFGRCRLLMSAAGLALLLGNLADAALFRAARSNGTSAQASEGKVADITDPLQRLRATSTAVQPFSFTYGGRESASLLSEWSAKETSQTLADGRRQVETVWSDPVTSLALTMQATLCDDFPAVDWVLYFENKGRADTPILENIQVLDTTTTRPLTGPASESSRGLIYYPLTGSASYRLQKLHGGVANPTMFEPTDVSLIEGMSETIGTFGGRTSTRNMPFFRIESGSGADLYAIEWSGTWLARFDCRNGTLRSRAGMEQTYFRLHPGERVRTPRVLNLHWPGATEEAHARFRRLIQKYYVPRRGGKAREPLVFCNTWFARPLLNETTADNQISLIKAYAALGAEAIITDAGWFDGGWPDGVGNWTPRKDNYPQGMAPVAAAAKEGGTVYGLWFEPEHVVAGTRFHRDHPDWVLALPGRTPGQTQAYVADFGRREVQDYFFEIVRGFMQLPGFRVYRQDFNMEPVAYWRASDEPDRQGIAEIRYVEGLYAYWERIRRTWPDCLMEECASGGRRIELGTVMRMDCHQKADYWFDCDADQTSLWSISQYLPNGTIEAHLRELDDYAFHSRLAASLCLGWVADSPDFDAARAKALLNRYRAVRPLLQGDWYPLTPYTWDYDYGQLPLSQQLWLWDARLRLNHTRPHTGWLGSQYHRADLDEGMMLVFRREASPYPSIEVKLRGLDPGATYLVHSDRTHRTSEVKGAQLMEHWVIELPSPRSSDLITYQKK